MSGIFDCKERVCFLAFRFPDDVCLAYVREKIYNGAMDEKIRINKYLSNIKFVKQLINLVLSVFMRVSRYFLFHFIVTNCIL